MKSKEQILQEIANLEIEANELKCEYDMYYRLAGEPKYPRDISDSNMGYVETYRGIAAKRRRINNRIRKLKESMN